MMNQKQWIWCICFFSLLLVACTGDNEDLVNYINKIKHRKTQEIEPLPSFAPLPSFKFPDNGNRRSPFEPTSQKKETDVNAPDKNRPKQPLEEYPLDSLKFVGTLKQGNDVWALIQPPNIGIIPVQIGDFMGQNYGRIVLIKNDSLELMETTQSSGRWEKHKITIELYTGKQE